MSARIQIQPMDAQAFKPFGDVLDCAGNPDKIINQGLCGRFHDRARLDFGANGRAGLSLFQAEPRALPLKLEMVERHPDGSQAFVPMSWHPFLVIVAPESQDGPDTPLAFETQPGQAVNFRPNTWHGVLCPLHKPGIFAVIDRIGDTPNLEEHWFSAPYMVYS